MNRFELLELAVGRAVPRETLTKLQQFEQLLIAENRRQNLISRSSEPDLWRRHIVDSAQLIRFEQGPRWLDVGAGAGLPGLVLAILGARVTLVEPRRLRAQFLATTIAQLELGERVELAASRVQKISGSFDTITARAFAGPGEILSLTRRLATRRTRWVLPRGRNGRSELAELGSSWQGAFRAEPSLTDGDATILIVSSPRPREAQ